MRRRASRSGARLNSTSQCVVTRQFELMPDLARGAHHSSPSSCAKCGFMELQRLRRLLLPGDVQSRHILECGGQRWGIANVCYDAANSEYDWGSRHGERGGLRREEMIGRTVV